MIFLWEKGGCCCVIDMLSADIYMNTRVHSDVMITDLGCLVIYLFILRSRVLTRACSFPRLYLTPLYQPCHNYKITLR